MAEGGGEVSGEKRPPRGTRGCVQIFGLKLLSCERGFGLVLCHLRGATRTNEFAAQEQRFRTATTEIQVTVRTSKRGKSFSKGRQCSVPGALSRAGWTALGRVYGGNQRLDRGRDGLQAFTCTHGGSGCLPAACLRTLSPRTSYGDVPRPVSKVLALYLQEGRLSGPRGKLLIPKMKVYDYISCCSS